jgi:hypothetical protein
MVKNLAQQGVINLSGVRPQLAKGPTKTLQDQTQAPVNFIPVYVYVYFGSSADFDYPHQFSPPLPRIIESPLYKAAVVLGHVPARLHLLNNVGCTVHTATRICMLVNLF